MVLFGYMGNVIWGSLLVIDMKCGVVYVVMGNNYLVLFVVLVCVVVVGVDVVVKVVCLLVDDYFDSVFVFDMKIGFVWWVMWVIFYDVWMVDCILFFGDGVNCLLLVGFDYDFG